MSRICLILLGLTLSLGAAEPVATGPRLLVCGWSLGYLAVYDGQGRGPKMQEFLQAYGRTACKEE